MASKTTTANISATEEAAPLLFMSVLNGAGRLSFVQGYVPIDEATMFATEEEWRAAMDADRTASVAALAIANVLSMRQAKLQLSRASILAQADAAIGSMEGQPGEEAGIEREYASELRRDHPLVNEIGIALGLMKRSTGCSRKPRRSSDVRAHQMQMVSASSSGRSDAIVFSTAARPPQAAFSLSPPHRRMTGHVRKAARFRALLSGRVRAGPYGPVLGTC